MGLFSDLAVMLMEETSKVNRVVREYRKKLGTDHVGL